MANFMMHKLPQSEKQVRSALNIPMHGKGMHMEGYGIDWGNIGRSIAKTLNIPTDTSGAKKLAKTAIKYALPAASSASLGALGSLAGGPLGGIAAGTMGGIAGRVAAEKANEQIGSGVRRGRGRPRKMAMEGSGGWLSGLLDKPVSARQVIKAAKSLPGLVEEAKQDIRGVGLAGDMIDMGMHGLVGKKMPKQAGITSGVVPMMSGKGAGRPAKGSQEAKDMMKALRERRGKK